MKIFKGILKTIFILAFLFLLCFVVFCWFIPFMKNGYSFFDVLKDIATSTFNGIIYTIKGI